MAPKVVVKDSSACEVGGMEMVIVKMKITDQALFTFTLNGE
jgi:hypothetical protein